MPSPAYGDMVQRGMAAKSSAMAPMADYDFQKSVTSIDGINGHINPDGHREGTWGMMNQMSYSGFYSEFESREAGGGEIYDCMALPDNFLGQYYSQVRNFVNIPTHYFLKPIVGFCCPGHSSF